MTMPYNPDRPSMLVSYHFLRKSDSLTKVVMTLSKNGLINLLIDSGAFSAWNTGAEIPIEEYIEWCKKYKDYVWQYIMLDVINNNEASRENYDKMIAEGLNPMAVLTGTEKIEMVKYYTQHNNHLCIAGGNSMTRAQMAYRLRTAYKMNPDIKVHALAFVKVPDMYKLPLFSADSLSYNAGGQFGNVIIFNRITKILDGIGRQIELRKPKISDISKKMKDWWVSIGMSPKDRNKDAMYTGSYYPSHLFTAYSYSQLQKYLRTLGKDYFYAISTKTQIWLCVYFWALSRSGRKFMFYEQYKRVMGARDRADNDPDKMIKEMTKEIKDEIKL